MNNSRNKQGTGLHLHTTYNTTKSELQRLLSDKEYKQLLVDLAYCVTCDRFVSPRVHQTDEGVKFYALFTLNREDFESGLWKDAPYRHASYWYDWLSDAEQEEEDE